MERQASHLDSPRPTTGELHLAPTTRMSYPWRLGEKTLYIPNLLFLAGVVLLGINTPNVLMYQLNSGEFG